MNGQGEKMRVYGGVERFWAGQPGDIAADFLHLGGISLTVIVVPPIPLGVRGQVRALATGLVPVGESGDASPHSKKKIAMVPEEKPGFPLRSAAGMTLDDFVPIF
jgi:hypothetical protein